MSGPLFSTADEKWPAHGVKFWDEVGRVKQPAAGCLPISANLGQASSRAVNASSAGRMQGWLEIQDCLERDFPLERALSMSDRFRSGRLLTDHRR